MAAPSAVGRNGEDVRPWRDHGARSHGDGVALTRLRMDELVNAWVADRFTPFQIALLGVFDAAPFLLSDGTLDVPRIRRELLARARRVEAFRRRVVWTRFGEGLPVWAPDPSFDPDQHIEGATLPEGVDLVTWAAHRILRPLPVDRPLWRVEIVDGLPRRRFALIVVVHHVAADGLTGVALAGSLLDRTPDAAPPETPVPQAPSLPSHADLVRDHLRNWWQRCAAPGRCPAPGSAGYAPWCGSSATPGRTCARAPPRHRCRGRWDRRAGWQSSGYRSTSSGARDTQEGGTVNDLLLAAVSGGLRALLSARGDDVAAMTLRTSVPAATAAAHQASGIMLVDLPVGEPDPLRRLAAIHATTARAKQRLYDGAGAITGVGHLPLPLARAGLRWMRRFGGTRVNLFVTDVPGPSSPLWLAGARMLEAVPVAPLVQHVGLGVAALSYAGELAVSVHADGSVTDLGVLAEGMAADFAAFRAAAATAGPGEPRDVTGLALSL